MRTEFPNGSSIEAEKISIGKDFQVGSNVRIKVRGSFTIGKCGRFGDNVIINAENVTIGDHFFHYTAGLNVGGGGSQFPGADLRIGDRCVLHNNYINLARAVYLGNDVGLSPDVDIITHGFWNSVLEGYPADYRSVYIDDGVIVGQRSIILPGTLIAKNIVIGANSTVLGELLKSKSIYAGNPVKFIRSIFELSQAEKEWTILKILQDYMSLGGDLYTRLDFKYPEIIIDNAVIDVENKTITGIETPVTDKFRDYLRRWGVRIYTDRPFVSPI